MNEYLTSLSANFPLFTKKELYNSNNDFGFLCKVVLRHYEHEFMELAVQCPAVVVCRCTPTQKAEIVRLLKAHTGKRTCSIGDGGNDVSMIQMADAGVGIEGKVIDCFSMRTFCPSSTRSLVLFKTPLNVFARGYFQSFLLCF